MANANAERTYSAEELSLFSAQVALVLRSGMFLPDGLAAMAEESGDGTIQEINKLVQGGEKLADALEKTGRFPTYMASMVRVGESSGKLEQVMGSLAKYYEREHSVREQVKSAVFYPIVLVCMMMIVIAVLLIKVLPVFADVYADLGGASSGISGGALTFGMVAGYVALGFAALLLAAGIFMMARMKTSIGYASLMRSLAKFGPAKKLVEKVATGRFAFALSMLLESGYSLDAALEELPGIVENDSVNKKLAECRAAVAGGEGFAKAVTQTGLFSGMYAHILGVGFRAGALDSVSARIAEIYEDETERAISSTVSAVEPALVAALCIVIGVVLLSVMLPLMNIMTSIG